jgi:hypothetical protein
MALTSVCLNPTRHSATLRRGEPRKREKLGANSFDYIVACHSTLFDYVVLGAVSWLAASFIACQVTQWAQFAFGHRVWN